jgi:multisubunit Na+/H+ antiporter MnhE subunit
VAWVLEVAVWWIVGTGVWLLGLSAVTASDLVLGVVAAFVGALVGTAGRRRVSGHWRPRARWFAQLPRVALAVVAETATVLIAAPMLGRQGTERRITLPREGSEDVRDAREALTTMALSVSPGSYVVDVDPERSELIVHALGHRTPAWARVDPDVR